jgi:anti-sigma B factor antagonist
MSLYELSDKNGVTIVSLRVDSLDAITVPELRSMIDQLAERGGKVVFDMGSVRVIDSSGVGVVVKLFKRLRDRGGALRLCRVAEQPAAIFRLMLIDKLLAPFASVDDALRGF